MINCDKCETELQVPSNQRIHNRIAKIVCPNCGKEHYIHLSNPKLNHRAGLIGPENGKPVVGLRG